MLHVRTFESDDLIAVCDEINSTGYGLTLGIHSRIDHWVDEIVDQVSVGNIYVNRNMIGAVVESQPFWWPWSLGYRPESRWFALFIALREGAYG